MTDRGDGPPDTIAFKLAAARISLADALVAANVSTLLITDEDALATADREAQVSAELAHLDHIDSLGWHLQGRIHPSLANDVIYRLCRGVSHTAQALDAVAAGSFRAQADYLKWDRPLESEISEGEGAKQLAERIANYAAQLQAIADEGRALFFGSAGFNPCGWDIRVATEDGEFPAERVKQLRARAE